MIGGFASGESDVLADQLSKLDRIAALAQSGKRSITLVGHTDPVGTDEYNRVLGSRRAAEVQRLLNIALERAGRGLSRRVVFYPSSAGASRPVASNDTASGRAQNRRVEIFLKADQTIDDTRDIPPPPPRRRDRIPNAPPPVRPKPPDQPPPPPPQPKIPQPPGPIVPWPGNVPNQPKLPPGGGKSRWLGVLTTIAGGLGVVVSTGLKTLSEDVLGRAVGFALDALVTEGISTVGIGLAGERAAEVILEEELGRLSKVFNLNELPGGKNFPVGDLITPNEFASVKNYGALAERTVKDMLPKYLDAYKAGTGRDWPVGNSHRQVTKAAKTMLDKMSKIPADALPASLRRVKTVEQMERVLQELYTLYVPEDHVVPVRNRLVEYLAQEMNVRVTINGKYIPGRVMTIRDAALIRNETGRIKSIGLPSSDFKVIIEAARETAEQIAKNKRKP